MQFQASEQSDSEEDFRIFFYVFLLFEPWTPVAGASWTLWSTSQCYIPNFKHLSQVVLKKKILEYFFYVFMYFNGSKLGPPSRGQLGPWDLGLNKFGEEPPGNATY